jgi:hypothetical protein
MNRNEFLRRQIEARADWESALDKIAALSDEQVDERQKSLVIHINWYEREMLGLLRQRAMAGSTLWDLPTDERNKVIELQESQLSLDVLVADGKDVYTRLLEELQRLPEDAFHSAQYFDQMPAEWSPWEVIASNLFEHYLEHAGEIREILER